MKWCTSGVRDLWDFSAVGQVSGLCMFPKESLKWDGNKMKSGTGEGVVTPVRLEKNSNTSIKHYQTISCFGGNLPWSPWLLLVILASKFWWWTWLYVSVADRLVSSQIWHGLVWHRFWPQALAEALKVNKTVTKINLTNNQIGNEGAEAWCLARGSVAPGPKWWNKME